MPFYAAPLSTVASINYCVPPANGIRAIQYAFKVDTSDDAAHQRNFSLETQEVVIENARGNEDLTLDSCGFQYLHDVSPHTAYTDDAEIISQYYPHCVDLIKRHTGASRVVIFDHTIRHRTLGEPASDDKRRQPLSQAHVDQSTSAAIARVHKHIAPEDVPRLLQRRFQIINLWRPIENPAYDWPLAVCDCRSVDISRDIIPVTLKYRDHEGETLGIRYNPNHRWKYFYGMTPDEVLFLKCFDSLQDGSVAILAPHTGFQDPHTPDDAPLRKSIEVRALVFYD